MAEKTLKDLLVHAMKDMYFAENAIYKALPKMIEGAEDEDLKEGLTEHREETKEQIARLEQMFGHLDLKPQSVTCEAIKGILEEGEEALKEFGGSPAGDAAVIFSCQAVEHYEIARYGGMHAWASELGLEDVADLIEETLTEEHAADEKLSALAEGGINEEAEGEGEEETQSGARGATARRAPQKRAAAKSVSGGAKKKSAARK
jgi:ferritin-like metal-binding protein YciE